MAKCKHGDGFIQIHQKYLDKIYDLQLSLNFNQTEIV